MVEVISVIPAGSWRGVRLVKATLERDGEFVTCDSTFIFDEECADDSMFDEWKESALAGEAGYSYVAKVAQ